MARSTAQKIVEPTTATAKSTPARKAASKTGAATAKAPVAKRATAPKAAAQKAPAKRTAPAKTASAKGASSGTAQSKSAPSRTTQSKTAPAKTTRSKTAPAKTTQSKTAPAKTAQAKTAQGKTAPTKTARGKTAPTKTAQVNGNAAPTRRHGKVSASTLAVKAGEDPWTSTELAEVRAELEADFSRLRGELTVADGELASLMRDAGDGAGNDQADVGFTTLERDHGLSLANNARDMLAQTERALGRIDDGTYGLCESCGEPIGKLRVMAFPRATLCLSCKQREERR